jgi:hypothetical protein
MISLLFSSRLGARVIMDIVHKHGYCVAVAGVRGWPRLSAKQNAKLQARLPDNLYGLGWTGKDSKIIAAAYSFNPLKAWHTFVDLMSVYLLDANEWNEFANNESVIAMRQHIEADAGIILPPIPAWKEKVTEGVVR